MNLKKIAAVMIALLPITTGILIAQSPPEPKPSTQAADASLPRPAHPITESQLQKMLAETHLLDTMHSLMRANIEAQKKSLPFFPEAFWTDVQDQFEKLDWTALILPAYQRYLSTEDADQMIAFYSTPLGQRLIEVQPRMTQDMQEVGMQAGMKIGQTTAEKYKAQIEENMRNAQSKPATTSSPIPTNPDTPK